MEGISSGPQPKRLEVTEKLFPVTAISPQQNAGTVIDPLVTSSVWEVCAPARAGDRSKRLKAIRRFILGPSAIANRSGAVRVPPASASELIRTTGSSAALQAAPFFYR
jgi:hypothetical protein